MNNLLKFISVVSLFMLINNTISKAQDVTFCLEQGTGNSVTQLLPCNGLVYTVVLNLSNNISTNGTINVSLPAGGTFDGATAYGADFTVTYPTSSTVIVVRLSANNIISIPFHLGGCDLVNATQLSQVFTCTATFDGIIPVPLSSIAPCTNLPSFPTQTAQAFQAAIIPPAIEFVTLTGANGSHDNAEYKRFETQSRYYRIKASTGRVDHFDLIINPEDDIFITKIEALTQNFTHIYDLFSSPQNSSCNLPVQADIPLTFLNNSFHDCVLNSAGSQFLNHNFIDADAGDYILIREIFIVNKVSDPQTGYTAFTSCDGFASEKSQYSVNIYCDGAPDPLCITSTPVGTIGVSCTQIPSIITTTVSVINPVQPCGLSSTFNLEVVIKNLYNNPPNIIPAENGMIQLSEVRVPINQLHFDFSTVAQGGLFQIVIGGQVLNPANNDWEIIGAYSVNSYIRIDLTHLNSNTANSLTNIYTGDFPVQPPTPIIYNFLPLNQSFTVELKNIKFLCQGYNNSDILQNPDAFAPDPFNPLSQNFNFFGSTSNNAIIYFNRICRMCENINPPNNDFYVLPNLVFKTH